MNTKKLARYFTGYLPNSKPINISDFVNIIENNFQIDNPNLVLYKNKFGSLEKDYLSLLANFSEEELKKITEGYGLDERLFSEALVADGAYSGDNETIDIELPQKILIVEDEKMIKAWNNLTSEFQINGIKILSSNGCSNDQWEESIINIQALNRSYNPKILRILDKDSLIDKYTETIAKKKRAKYRTLDYSIEFLNVNEIENYILLDPTFNETQFFKKGLVRNINEFIDNIYESEKIEVTFRTTANDKLNQYAKEFDLRYGNSEPEKQELVDYMKSSKIKFLNGKEIVSLVNKHFPEGNLNKEKFLETLNLASFSEELIQTLSIIKDYFVN